MDENKITIYQGKNEVVVFEVPEDFDVEAAVRVVFAMKSGEFGDILYEYEMDYFDGLGGYKLWMGHDDTESIPEGIYTYDVSWYDSGDQFWVLVPASPIEVKRGVGRFSEEV